MSTEPKQDAPSGSGSAASEAPAEQAVEEKTAPHHLVDLAAREAKKRRRSTAATLVVKRPRQTEVRVPLDRTETVIGRDPSCDIVLQEDAASRRHAKITRNDGGYFEVVDLDSHNGVLVDEEKIAGRMTLLDGDSFVVGDTRFTIAIGAVVGADAS